MSYHEAPCRDRAATRPARHFRMAAARCIAADASYPRAHGTFITPSLWRRSSSPRSSPSSRISRIASGGERWLSREATPATVLAPESYLGGTGGSASRTESWHPLLSPTGRRLSETGAILDDLRQQSPGALLAPCSRMAPPPPRTPAASRRPLGHVPSDLRPASTAQTLPARSGDHCVQRWACYWQPCRPPRRGRRRRTLALPLQPFHQARSPATRRRILRRSACDRHRPAPSSGWRGLRWRHVTACNTPASLSPKLPLTGSPATTMLPSHCHGSACYSTATTWHLQCLVGDCPRVPGGVVACGGGGFQPGEDDRLVPAALRRCAAHNDSLRQPGPRPAR